MSEMRPEEAWAQQVMATALGTEVWLHDDSSREAMFDFAMPRNPSDPARAS